MEDEKAKEKFCPFIQSACRQDCMLLRRSEDSMVKQCCFAIIAEQIDMLSNKDSRKKF